MISTIAPETLYLVGAALLAIAGEFFAIGFYLVLAGFAMLPYLIVADINGIFRSVLIALTLLFFVRGFFVERAAHQNQGKNK